MSRSSLSAAASFPAIADCVSPIRTASIVARFSSYRRVAMTVTPCTNGQSRDCPPMDIHQSLADTVHILCQHVKYQRRVCYQLTVHFLVHWWQRGDAYQVACKLPLPCPDNGHALPDDRICPIQCRQCIVCFDESACLLRCHDRHSLRTIVSHTPWLPSARHSYGQGAVSVSTPIHTPDRRWCCALRAVPMPHHLPHCLR